MLKNGTDNNKEKLKQRGIDFKIEKETISELSSLSEKTRRLMANCSPEEIKELCINSRYPYKKIITNESNPLQPKIMKIGEAREGEKILRTLCELDGSSDCTSWDYDMLRTISEPPNFTNEHKNSIVASLDPEAEDVDHLTCVIDRLSANPYLIQSTEIQKIILEILDGNAKVSDFEKNLTPSEYIDLRFMLPEKSPEKIKTFNKFVGRIFTKDGQITSMLIPGEEEKKRRIDLLTKNSSPERELIQKSRNLVENLLFSPTLRDALQELGREDLEEMKSQFNSAEIILKDCSIQLKLNLLSQISTEEIYELIHALRKTKINDLFLSLKLNKNALNTKDKILTALKI